MTHAERLASFVGRASYHDLSAAAIEQLKIHVLDALGCAIGAVDSEPARIVGQHVEDFGGRGRSSLIGGGRTAPDRAAFYNGVLVRYLDFNDAYLAPGETCHPSDNLAPVLAAAEQAGASGRDFLCALAVAYQVQCRLSDEAPVRAKGFDHTAQGAFAVAAGVAKALALDTRRTANAIAIAGTAFNGLRVTRTGALSHWKGLAYPNTASCATNAVFLAMRGITGPSEVFEGNKGFMDSIAGHFEIDWDREDLERVTRTILKKYNAEIHSQSAIEAILELRERCDIDPGTVEEISIEIFDVAFNIIGGGEEGEKTTVRTKEEADHSLQYMVAAALLDGALEVEQYRPERIERRDVQSLLRKIRVRKSDEFSRRFPNEVPCRLIVRLHEGRELSVEKRDYEGFHTRPMPWLRVINKFEKLAAPYIDTSLTCDIIGAVASLESSSITSLTRLLERVHVPERMQAARIDGRENVSDASKEQQ